MKVARAMVLALAIVAGSRLVAAADFDNLGHIDFPNSGSPEAQEAFIRGVLLLHSFEYEDARDAFREAEKIDPDFTLAFWGEAMTFNHPLWAQQDRDAAREALDRLAPTMEQRLLQTPTRRERGYLGAVEILYGDGDKTSRDLAYMDAMRRLHERNPDDLEAAAFFALSILGSVPERDFRTYMRAAAVAEEVFARNPRHPGAVHYLIHSYDDPIHAPLGLRAARVYSRIAPDASHAQHMISHIYTALGMWDKVVEANVKAVRVSEERLIRKGMPLDRRSHHALYWLEYALLQQGRFGEARSTVETMKADALAHPGDGNLWHYAEMRAAYLVADPLAADAPPSIDLPGVTVDAVAADAFATALSSLARDDREAAERAAATIREALERARITNPGEGKNAYDGANGPNEIDVARILARELDALLIWNAGDRDGAVAAMKDATADEDARALEYGPPSVVKPSHELLGEMLLAMDGRAEDARAELARALDLAPRRTASLSGLSRAHHALGNEAASSQARAMVHEQWLGDEDAAERMAAAGDRVLGSEKDSHTRGE